MKKGKKHVYFFILALLYIAAGSAVLVKIREVRQGSAITDKTVPEIKKQKKEIDSKTVPASGYTDKVLINPYKKQNVKASQFFTAFFSALYREHYTHIRVKAYDYMTEELKMKMQQAMKDEHALDDAGISAEKYFFIELQKTLKYHSVYDLPFVKGMQQALKSKKSSRYMRNIFEKKLNELKPYIGMEQAEYSILKVRIDSNNHFIANTISISTYHDSESVKYLKPLTGSRIQSEGERFLYTAAELKNDRIYYNNSTAVAYAIRYSSNPFQKECRQSVWNKQYHAYENDCANFVSQCLYNGGIQKSKSWQEDSLYWVRTGSARTKTGGLATYMQESNVFFPVDYSAVSAGGFICLQDESHVVLVTSNDSITILYNGHTNDRSLFCFPHFENQKAIYLTPNNF